MVNTISQKSDIMNSIMSQDTKSALDGEKLQECLKKAKELYTLQNELYCPYFGLKIHLTSDGFYHLQNKPNRQPRNVKEQIVKLMLLKKALKTIPKCGTLQEYRELNEKIGKKRPDGFYKMKVVRYWGFHSILEDKEHKIKVILKQIGDGKVMFWSVMPYNQILYLEGITED